MNSAHRCVSKLMTLSNYQGGIKGTLISVGGFNTLRTLKAFTHSSSLYSIYLTLPIMFNNLLRVVVTASALTLAHVCFHIFPNLRLGLTEHCAQYRPKSWQMATTRSRALARPTLLATCLELRTLRPSPSTTLLVLRGTTSPYIFILLQKNCSNCLQFYGCVVARHQKLGRCGVHYD